VTVTVYTVHVGCLVLWDVVLWAVLCCGSYSYVGCFMMGFVTDINAVLLLVSGLSRVGWF
jgi:hypothetical protein